LLRVLEALSGGCAWLVGWGTLAYLFCVPVLRGVGCSTLLGQPVACQPAYATLLNREDTNTLVEAILLAALFLDGGIAAIWDALAKRRGPRIALYTGTGILFLWMLIPQLAPGALLLPSVGLAFLASLSSVSIATPTAQH
jgi:hypothetical protein